MYNWISGCSAPFSDNPKEMEKWNIIFYGKQHIWQSANSVVHVAYILLKNSDSRFPIADPVTIRFNTKSWSNLGNLLRQPYLQQFFHPMAITGKQGHDQL
jgi:hypothetical protein